MKKIVLVKDWNGLKKGSEFYLDNGFYIFKEESEDITDNSVSKKSYNVKLSEGFVNSKWNELFENSLEYNSSKEIADKLRKEIAIIEKEIRDLEIAIENKSNVLFDLNNELELHTQIKVIPPEQYVKEKYPYTYDECDSCKKQDEKEVALKYANKNGRKRK